MGAIVLDLSKPSSRCACCGGLAETSISFRGAGANRKAKVIVCGVCKRLLGEMLRRSETPLP